MPFFVFIGLYFLADLIALLMLGEQIGVLATLLWIFLTSAIGVYLIRYEGYEAIRNAQLQFRQNLFYQFNWWRQGTLIFAGIMLFLPGPISNLIGLICLLNIAFRRLVQAYQAKNILLNTSKKDTNIKQKTKKDSQNYNQEQKKPIEGDYIERDSDLH